MGKLVIASSEGRPPVQLLDLESGDVTPVPTAIDREGAAFDNAVAREGWVAIEIGSDVTAFADGSLLNPVALPPAWQLRPGLAADELLLTVYEGHSRGDEPVAVVVVGGDGLVRRTATLPLWHPIGEIEGFIVTEDGLWSWTGERHDHRADGRAVAVLEGRVLVMQHENTVRVVTTNGELLAGCEVPGSERFGLDVQYDARAARMAATAFGQHGVLVATGDSARWIALPFEPYHPVWLDDQHLLFFDYYTSVATTLDIQTEDTSDLKLPRRCPVPKISVDGRFDPAELQAVLRPAAWSPPTPDERDAEYDRQRSGLNAAAPASVRRFAQDARPSVQLRGYLPEKRTPLGTSRLGGRPDLPPGTKWPKFDGSPMAFLAQIRLDDAAAVAPDGALPASGLLTVFVGLEADGMYPVADDAVTAWKFDTSELKRARWPAGLSDELRFGESQLLPAPMLSLPDEPEGLDDDDADTWLEFLESATPPAPRHRMLGYPASIQGYEPQPDRVLLIQIDSDGIAGLSFGDGGNLQVFASSAALAAGRIEECTVDIDSY